MAKISPVSIKYMIDAYFRVEGSLEKPDVIGAIFGQTEGLLGNDLEMRELQKEGKIGRIEVMLDKKDKITSGSIKIPTALDQSETSLIAAAIETIDKIGPSDAQIEVKKIEDVRGGKRDYILERAKNLMKDFKDSTDSREISNEIRISSRTSELKEYGDEKLPCGDLSGKEIIVVEGRADVLNLMRNNIDNVLAMNGTKLPNAIRELGQEKDITLFVDGDRGGKLIISNVLDNAKIKDIVIAPVGREVEELTGKEILMSLRKRVPVEEYLEKEFRWNKRQNGSSYNGRKNYQRGGYKEKTEEKPREKSKEKIDFSEDDKKKLKQFSSEIDSTGKAILLDNNMEKSKEISVKGLSNFLKRRSNDLKAIAMDGTVTNSVIKSAEEAGCQAIMAKNFASSDTNMKLFSL